MSAGGVREQIVTAQGIPNAVRNPPEPRFAISAWALSDQAETSPQVANNPQAAVNPQAPVNPQPANVARANRGCYIIDTITGELWHAAGDGKPVKISEKLR
jgi:hypothetical protein